MTPTARGLLLLAALTILSGCAAPLPPGHSPDPRDPFEAYNRSVFEFNTRVDEAVIRPVAEVYQAAVPSPIRKGVSNFFSNLSEVATTVHHLLQAEGIQATQSAGRFLVNTTIGVLGVFDPASEMGISKTGKEDFGQTFGRWGAEPGAYLVLPLMGPSTARDAFGTALDIALDPVGLTTEMDSDWRTATWGLRLVDTRVSVFALEEMVNRVSFDRYLTIREGYLARRQQQVGESPRLPQSP